MTSVFLHSGGDSIPFWDPRRRAEKSTTAVRWIGSRRIDLHPLVRAREIGHRRINLAASRRSDRSGGGSIPFWLVCHVLDGDEDLKMAIGE
uniref:Uncharacterized protein n=1 Tax=Leersia perrieri TaxID=77586 RepID=A0A0D9WZR7_9ORYZ